MTEDELARRICGFCLAEQRRAEQLRQAAREAEQSNHAQMLAYYIEEAAAADRRADWWRQELDVALQRGAKEGCILEENRV